MASPLLARDAAAAETVFYLGAARWRASLAAVITHVEAWAVTAPHAWQTLMQAPYAHTSDHMPPIWRAQLAAVQAGRCFWCGQPWTATTVSVEHVVPYASALWAHAPRLEQLLSLRLSHQACNHAYNAWRLTQAAPRLAALDTRLLRQVRQGIAQSPTLQLAAYHHYRAV